MSMNSFFNNFRIRAQLLLACFLPIGAAHSEEAKTACRQGFDKVWENVVNGGAFRVDAPKMVHDGTGFRLIELDFPGKVHLIIGNNASALEIISMDDRVWTNSLGSWSELDLKNPTTATIGIAMAVQTALMMVASNMFGKVDCVDPVLLDGKLLKRYVISGPAAAVTSSMATDNPGDMSSILYVDPTKDLPVYIRSRPADMSFSFDRVTEIKAP